MMHVVCTTKDGLSVTVDLIHSNAARRIAHRPHLLTLASEVLSTIVVDTSRLVTTHDMGRNVGYEFVVPIVDVTATFYAQLVKETVYTTFTKKGEPTATSLLTIVLRRTEHGDYVLDDLWPGAFHPPRPGELTATVSSKAYWEQHAYLFEDQHIQPSTLTKTCPY